MLLLVRGRVRARDVARSASVPEARGGVPTKDWSATAVYAARAGHLHVGSFLNQPVATSAYCSSPPLAPRGPCRYSPFSLGRHPVLRKR